MISVALPLLFRLGTGSVRIQDSGVADTDTKACTAMPVIPYVA